LRRLLRKITEPPYAALPWLIWLYAIVCFFMNRNGGVWTGELVGYDDHVRMTQILNWVNAAGWYDRLISRVDPPDGFRTIWSRLVDIPFAAVILLAQQFVDQKTAALIAAVIIPFVELAIVFRAAAYFAGPLVGRRSQNLIILFIMFTTVFNFHVFALAGFHPGQASHHAWYVILGLLFFGGIARSVIGIRSLWMIAVTTALMLAVGIEAYALLGVGCLMVGFIGWFYQYAKLAKHLARAMFAAAVISLILLPLHQPVESFFHVSFAEPSILSCILLSSFAIIFCAEGYILEQVRDKKNSLFLILFVVSIVTGIIIICLPAMLDGPAAALSVAERALARKEHPEAQPLHKIVTDWADAISLYMPLVLAFIGGALAVRNAASKRRQALTLCYFGFSTLTLGMAEIYSRLYHHALTTGSVLVLDLWRRMGRTIPRSRIRTILSVIIFTLFIPVATLLPDIIHGRSWSEILFFSSKYQAVRDPCQMVVFAKFLDDHYPPETNVLIAGSESSRLLYYSHVMVDFLNNYPSQNRFIDNQVFLGTQDYEMSHQIAQRHHVDLVAVCPALMKVQPLRPGEQPMLYETLLLNQTPKWLKPIDTGLGQGYKLWSVIQN